MSEQDLVPNSGGGVSSVNGESGAISLTSTGATVAITTPSGSTINLETSGSGAPTGATYVTLTNNGALTANRTLAVSSNLSLTDGGATSTVTVGTGAFSGDVTTSANSFSTTIAANAVTTAKINNSVVTYAKIQNETASTLLGNPTGAGAAPSEVTLGATLAFSGSALQTVALTSDVTSSANSFSTTVSKIQGTTVSGTTGTTNVVFSTGPTLSNPVVGTQSTADNSTKAASTAYVTTAINNAIAGVNPAVAVFAATTQASDTSGLTYSNGVSGIGATFTGSVNTALTFDGQTITSLNQRVLIKNDTQAPSGAFNGIYYLTQLQTGILAPILTRALDYDQPSDINNTGAIPVVNGTVNANTSWLLTSTVNTVGTDPLTFVQFSIAPSTIVTLTGTQTLTNKRITKRVVTAADATSVTPNTDNADITYQSNSQAGGTLTINADGGTPTNGQMWIFKIKSTNAQTYSWNAQYVSGSGTGSVTLPTASTAGKIDNIGFIFDTVNSKWQCIAYAPGY